MEVASPDRQRIQVAAHRFEVEAGLVGAILLDEAQRRDFWDAAQDVLGHLLLDLPRPLALVTQQFAERVTGRPLTDQSFGFSQMKPATIDELAAVQLLPIPNNLRLQLALLLDRTYAPLLVAARLRQIVNHWAAGGVDLTQRPEILGTLYSIGLSGQCGVHQTPQANSRGKAIAALARRLA